MQCLPQTKYFINNKQSHDSFRGFLFCKIIFSIGIVHKIDVKKTAKCSKFAKKCKKLLYFCHFFTFKTWHLQRGGGYNRFVYSTQRNLCITVIWCLIVLILHDNTPNCHRTLQKTVQRPADFCKRCNKLCCCVTKLSQICTDFFKSTHKNYSLHVLTRKNRKNCSPKTLSSCNFYANVHANVAKKCPKVPFF